MRILLSDRDATGGLATHVTLLAGQLVERGHDVTIATGWSAGPRIADHRQSGAAVVSTPLVELLTKERFDAVNLTDNDLTVLRPQTVRHAVSPVVVTVHSERDRVDARGCDAMVMVRAGQVQRTRPVTARRDAVVIPNPVPLDRFTVEGPCLDVGCGPVVAWFGRPAHPRKGLDVFLEVAASVEPHVRPLLVVEHGWEAEAVAMTSHLSTASVVSVGWAEIPALLRGIRECGGCVLLTSRSEGDPIVVGEAVACGTPVVCPAIPAMDGWARLGAVTTYEPSDVRAAAHAVRSVACERPSIEAACARRALFPPDRTLEHWGARFDALLRSVAQAHRRAAARRRGPSRPPQAVPPRARRIGVAVTTFRRPELAWMQLEGLVSLGPRIARVCVVENGATAPSWTRPPALDARVDFDVLVNERNDGLPAALARAFEHLAGCDAALVLDDDTVVSPAVFDELRAQLDGGAGIAAVATTACIRSSPADRTAVFAWSPSLVRRAVLDDVGPPDARLFFGYDDYEFGCRASAAGWRIVASHVPVPYRRRRDDWPERRYFGVRNAVWLATRHARTAVYWRLAGTELRDGTRHVARRVVRRRNPSAAARELRALVTGLVHGVTGRLGPPPPWVLEGRP